MRSPAPERHTAVFEPLFLTVAFTAMLVVVYLVLVLLFEPPLPYTITRVPPVPLDSPKYLRILEALTDSTVHWYTRVEVLTNGPSFYESELEAIRNAQHSINLEAYIFQKGELTARFIEAMAERAREGVRVNLVVDAIGSFGLRRRHVRELLDAGGRVEVYHPLRWHSIFRLNHRTHREILVVDGKIGFVGGAGFADHWLKDSKRHPRWRDTMVRIEGDAVVSLQSAFAENWLEASGELLCNGGYFPEIPRKPGNGGAALVVNSTPSTGRSTRARILFQMLLASATKYIHITTPYFLPDYSARTELIRALRDRGVEVVILTPGTKNDHLLTRRSSRRLYGELLQAGAKIYEYEPAMMHTKCLVVDGVWSVTGSTNFDPRSFGINDEINLAVCDPDLAARLDRDFLEDLSSSRRISYDSWKKRPHWERAHEWLGWLLERQQ